MAANMSSSETTRAWLRVGIRYLRHCSWYRLDTRASYSLVLLRCLDAAANIAFSNIGHALAFLGTEVWNCLRGSHTSSYKTRQAGIDAGGWMLHTYPYCKILNIVSE